ARRSASSRTCIPSAICTSPRPLSQLAVCRHRSSVRGHRRTFWERRNRFKQRGHHIMRTLRGWIIASWILLPGVIAGGTLLLRRVALGDPTAYQITWLRAFHAHGGVLFVLSLIYFLFLSQTTLSMSVKHLAATNAWPRFFPAVRVKTIR